MLRVVLLFLAVASTRAMVCETDVCKNFACDAVTAENCEGTVKKNGGYCGCCDICVLSLAEGDQCISPLLGVPLDGKCADGLECDLQSQKCRKPLTQVNGMTCAEHAQQIQSAVISGMTLLGQFKPKCAADGTYAPVQCHGSVCYCVDSTGVEIEGYKVNIGQSADMNCNCAREKDAYMQTGLIGKMFYCADNGNYKSYRCTGSVCYCADEEGNKRANSPSVNIGNLGSLQC